MRERPTRPIPSRRVPESAALWMGSEFIILGVALAWLVSFFAATPLTGLTAFLLAGAVIFYDGYFKKTSFGPIGMGLCRMLNVLMGMTAAGGTFTGAVGFGSEDESAASQSNLFTFS